MRSTRRDELGVLAAVLVALVFLAMLGVLSALSTRALISEVHTQNQKIEQLHQQIDDLEGGGR